MGRRKRLVGGVVVGAAIVVCLWIFDLFYLGGILVDGLSEEGGH